MNARSPGYIKHTTNNNRPNSFSLKILSINYENFLFTRCLKLHHLYIQYSVEKVKKIHSIAVTVFFSSFRLLVDSLSMSHPWWIELQFSSFQFSFFWLSWGWISIVFSQVNAYLIDTEHSSACEPTNLRSTFLLSLGCHLLCCHSIVKNRYWSHQEQCRGFACNH